MQKIIPNLWFEGNGEEAAKFYVDTFNNAPYSQKNSKVGKITRYDAPSAEVSGQPEGSVLTVEFTLGGLDYVAINGGPIFKFTEAVSFSIDCKDQAEVDYFWEKLLEGGGQESQCGWLKDKFGLSWQVVPRALVDFLNDPDPEKSKRVMEAMLKMVKLDVATFQKAYEGK